MIEQSTKKYILACADPMTGFQRIGCGEMTDEQCRDIKKLLEDNFEGLSPKVMKWSGTETANPGIRIFW